MGKMKANAAADENVGAATASNITPISAARRDSGATVAVATGDKKASPADAAFVVFGRDDAGKPHASWFGPADAELAIKAAGLMGFQGFANYKRRALHGYLGAGSGPRLRFGASILAILQRGRLRGAGSVS